MDFVKLKKLFLVDLPKAIAEEGCKPSVQAQLARSFGAKLTKEQIKELTQPQYWKTIHEDILVNLVENHFFVFNHQGSNWENRIGAGVLLNKDNTIILSIIINIH